MALWERSKCTYAHTFKNANSIYGYWRKTVERNRERLMKKIHVLLGQIAAKVVFQCRVIGHPGDICHLENDFRTGELCAFPREHIRRINLFGGDGLIDLLQIFIMANRLFFAIKIVVE